MVTQKRIKELFVYHDGMLIPVDKYRSGVRKYVLKGDRKGYVRISVDGRFYPLHWLVFLYHHGYLPKQVDHVSNDTSNNCIENLRECTGSQNQHNARIRKNNTSGVKGITWCKLNKKWLARVRCNWKTHFVGYFEDLGEAERELKLVREKLHGEFTNHG